MFDLITHKPHLTLFRIHISRKQNLCLWVDISKMRFFLRRRITLICILAILIESWQEGSRTSSGLSSRTRIAETLGRGLGERLKKTQGKMYPCSIRTERVIWGKSVYQGGLEAYDELVPKSEQILWWVSVSLHNLSHLSPIQAGLRRVRPLNYSPSLRQSDV